MVLYGNVFCIQVIDVIIDLVASHMGFFVFTLCENNNPDRDPDMDCFLKHRLKFEDGSDIYMAPKKSGRQNLRLKLPGGCHVHTIFLFYVLNICLKIFEFKHKKQDYW